MENIGDNGMNEGVNNFQANIPDEATGILFTAGDKGLNHEGWYTNGQQDAEGKFTAIPWDGGTSGGSKIVKFSNNQKWGEVYVHAWAGDTPLTNWPGIKMENIGDNGMNEGVNNFQASIPDNATGKAVPRQRISPTSTTRAGIPTVSRTQKASLPRSRGTAAQAAVQGS